MSNEENHGNDSTVGSSPTFGANFPQQTRANEDNRTNSAQEAEESAAKVRFPKVIKHRTGKVVIYAKKPAYPFFRLSYRVDGKRFLKSIATYSAAKKEAEKLAKDLAAGSPVAGLSPSQARDAITALQRLQSLFVSSGRRLSLLAAVSQVADALERLNGRSLGDAVDGYLKTVATVKRKALSEAVEEFIALRAPKAVAQKGKRSILNPKYFENTSSWLRNFSKTFQGHVIGDLTKEHLNLYVHQFANLSPKSRNDRRAVVKLFFSWCVRNDFLSPSHRLAEADGMQLEQRETAPTDCYRREELRSLLENAEGQMCAVIALQAFGGLRLEEALRLDWRNVFGIPGHVEVSTAKSKTRSRRLVEICPALEQWLASFRECEGVIGKTWGNLNGYVRAFAELRTRLGIPSRKNGLRHGFCTAHFALHSNENLTAAQAGNTPQMIHQHYRGLLPRSDAEKWFDTFPLKSAENIVSFQKAANE